MVLLKLADQQQVDPDHELLQHDDAEVHEDKRNMVQNVSNTVTDRLFIEYLREVEDTGCLTHCHEEEAPLQVFMSHRPIVLSPLLLVEDLEPNSEARGHTVDVEEDHASHLGLRKATVACKLNIIRLLFGPSCQLEHGLPTLLYG